MVVNLHVLIDSIMLVNITSDSIIYMTNESTLDALKMIVIISE